MLPMASGRYSLMDIEPTFRVAMINRVLVCCSIRSLVGARPCVLWDSGTPLAAHQIQIVAETNTGLPSFLRQPACITDARLMFSANRSCAASTLAEYPKIFSLAQVTDSAGVETISVHLVDT